MYATGRGVARDDAESLKWYRLAARGNAEAQCELGLMIALGRGTTPDYAEGYARVLVAVENGAAAHEALELLRQKMSAAQIEDGLRRAEEFRSELHVKASGSNRR